jgi:hypothetical protein
MNRLLLLGAVISSHVVFIRRCCQGVPFLWRNGRIQLRPFCRQLIKLANSEEYAAYLKQSNENLGASNGKELVAGRLFHSNCSFITDSIGLQSVLNGEKKF